MKKSLLALAIASSGFNAHAAWQNGVTPDLTTGNGEAILSVWDSVSGSSYVQDLGVTFNELRAGYTGAIDLNGAVLSQAFATMADLSTLQYGVWAFSNAQYSLPNYDLALTQAGFVYSLASDQHYLSQIANASSYLAAEVAWDAATQYSQILNFSTDTYGALPVRAGYSYGVYLEQNFQNNFARDFSASNGQSSQLWLQGFSDNEGNHQLQQMLATATLNITSANSGTLTISSVPVPAAACLFGSALVGLGGIARRRTPAERGRINITTD